MKVGDTVVNFDRIMRITLWYAGGMHTETVDGKVVPVTYVVGEGENTDVKTVVLEYAPMANVSAYYDKEGNKLKSSVDNSIVKTASGASLCPMMEVEINDIINPQKKNGLPGFTAKITITNPDEYSRRIIAQHRSWTLDFVENPRKFEEALQGSDKKELAEAQDALKKYYNSRVRVRVEAGYWRSENTDSNAEKRDYRTIFEGYVNSSSYFRKGIDDKLLLLCHNFDTTAMSTDAVLAAIGRGNRSSDKLKQFETLSRSHQLLRTGAGVKNWDEMAKKLIRNFAQTAPEKQGTSVYSMVVDWAKRKKNDWYQVLYIKGKNKKTEPYEQLKEKALNTKVNRFYSVGPLLYDDLGMLSTYGGMNVDFEIDENFAPGKLTVFFWPKGDGIRFTRANGAEIQIVNHQNLIEAPTVAGSGALTIKMFFNPDCAPEKRIALVLDETKEGYDKAALSFTSDVGAYAASVQLDRAASLNALQVGRNKRGAATVVNRGYLYNTGFPISRLTHSLATHGNNWYTTVQTIPMGVGILGGD